MKHLGSTLDDAIGECRLDNIGSKKSNGKMYY
jgi:tRNA A37 threonylcarbamoyltransferase TsaD